MKEIFNLTTGLIWAFLSLLKFKIQNFIFYNPKRKPVYPLSRQNSLQPRKVQAKEIYLRRNKISGNFLYLFFVKFFKKFGENLNKKKTFFIKYIQYHTV